MPRIHKRRPGSRRYLDYTKDRLKDAVDAVKSGRMSKRAAAEEYGIPRTSITRRLDAGDKSPQKPGRPPVLSKEVEDIIVKRIEIMCDWGFPLDGNDLKHIVQSYLNKIGVTEPRFKDNKPNNDFVFHFKHRHPELTERFAGNIKRSRAAVSHAVINDFFDNLEKELEGFSADDIYNYDETNLSDDPGRKKCLMKRGTKYPERIMNHSKASTSIMFCGNAAGEMLPVYVVYKAENIYNGWMVGGPEKARYSCSKSGWFDGNTFEDWFKTIFLPVARRKEKTALIGDNLSSHFSDEVLDLCKRHNVKFICLPPNSTDKIQPLDVAYFRSLKCNWRKILNDFKERNKGAGTVPKTKFPKLLSELLIAVKPDILCSGFKKCGIYPLDRHIVLQRIPNDEASKTANKDIDACLIDLLNRSSVKDKMPTKRGPKVNLQPGKDLSATAATANESEDEYDSDPGDDSYSDIDNEQDSDIDLVVDGCAESNKENVYEAKRLKSMGDDSDDDEGQPKEGDLMIT